MKRKYYGVIFRIIYDSFGDELERTESIRTTYAASKAKALSNIRYHELNIRPIDDREQIYIDIMEVV